MSPEETIQWVRRARLLAVLTIAYNIIEALACAWFGLKEETLSVLGFGSDSLLEAVSGSIILWRFKGEGSAYSSSHAQEGTAQRLIGWLFVLFAAALVVGAGLRWWQGGEVGSGLPGIVIAAISLSVMGFLYVAKMKAARALDSHALRADAFATLSCMWLSGLLLAGSLLLEATSQAVFDSITSVVIAVILFREGREHIEGEDEDD